MTCYSALQFILLKMSINVSLKQNRYFSISGVFPVLGPILTAGLTVGFSKKRFMAINSPIKK